ncbi:MAG: Asp-tRNA(Asn)/Glu-tRNA(Gln) amidotransferase GatCAB subunit B, partial [Syntrophomonadaceae bacterium]|nr:Asp-tRNA(Asn)/Glu-tRNA(Gln) amidotransferase GatCAB subunit B [Syntrophomonadaceae bacterium]
EFLAYFDDCLAHYHDAKTVSNWMMGELSKHLNQNNMEISDCKIKPVALTRMLTLIDEGTISGKMAKIVFEQMFDSGEEPDLIIKEKGMVQISDASTLLKIIDEIIAANPGVVEDYRSGKEKAFGFFVGQVMKATRGQANPAVVNKLLKDCLKGD